MSAASASHVRPSWRRFAGWVAVTYFGFAVFGDIHLQSAGATASFDPSDISGEGALVGFLFGAVSGALIGSLQLIILRSWVPSARGWIPFTAIGFGLAHAMNDAVPYRPLDLVATLLIGGVLVGAMQAIALRHVFPRPWLWVAVVALAWSLGWTVATVVVGAIVRNPVAELFFGNGGAGLVIGAITGAALVLQLGPSPASEGRVQASE